MDLQLVPCWITSAVLVLLFATLQEFVTAESQCDGDKESCDTQSSHCTDCDKKDEASISKNWWKNAKSIYDFTVTDIDGDRVSLTKYKGHVCLIVNVACFCGYTSSNYAQLQQLYNELSESSGLRVLAFPCNQFGAQEPGSHEEIKQFVAARAVTFDMFTKIEVNGENAEPLWRYLKYRYSPSEQEWFIPWNFSKFLIDKNGQPVGYYSHSVNPLDIKEDLYSYL